MTLGRDPAAKSPQRPRHRQPSRAALAGALVVSSCLAAASSACDAGPEPNAVFPPPPVDGTFEAVSLSGSGDFTLLGDCDADGRPDLFTGFSLARNSAEGLTPFVRMFDGLPVRAGALADLDGDALIDLVVAGEQGALWLRGEGDCRFSHPLPVMGAEGRKALQVTARDVDLDGLTDLSISFEENPVRGFALLLAKGDGTFVDATPPMTPGSNPNGRPYTSWGTFFHDVDGDGRLDLFAMIDRELGWFSWGVSGALPSFETAPGETELLRMACPMSLAMLDADRDGLPDYFLSGVQRAGSSENRLFRRAQGSRALIESSASRGLRAGSATAWGVVAADLDLDGWTDLFALTGDQGDGMPMPPVVQMNRGDGTFGRADIVPGINVEKRMLACGDLDDDGRIDCIAQRPVADSRFVLMANRITPRGRWIKLQLHGTLSEPSAAGATVSIDGVLPPLEQTVHGHATLGGQHDAPLVFAIGDRDQIDATIRWPSGLTSHATGLRHGRLHHLREPEVLTLSARTAAAGGDGVTITARPSAASAANLDLSCASACDLKLESLDASGTAVYRLSSPVAARTRLVLTLDGRRLPLSPAVDFH